MKIKFIGVLMCMALILSLVSAQSPILTKNETFDKMPDNYSIPNINHTDKWVINNSKLEIRDWENQIDFDRIFIFTDKSYSASDNYTFSATIHRDYFNNGMDQIGLIVGYNPNSDGVFPNQIYYHFSTSYNQAWFYGRGIKWGSGYWSSHCLVDNCSVAYDLDKPHRLQINVNPGKVTLIINGIIVKELDVDVGDGFVGLYIWDASDSHGNYINARNYFDDVMIYKQPTFSNQTPTNNTNVEINEEQNFSIVVDKIEHPLVSGKLVIYNESNITHTQGNLTEVEFSKDMIEEINADLINNDGKVEVSASKIFREKGIFKWFFIVVDYFGNIFNSDTETITVTDQEKISEISK